MPQPIDSAGKPIEFSALCCLPDDIHILLGANDAKIYLYAYVQEQKAYVQQGVFFDYQREMNLQPKDKEGKGSEEAIEHKVSDVSITAIL